MTTKIYRPDFTRKDDLVYYPICVNCEREGRIDVVLWPMMASLDCEDEIIGLCCPVCGATKYIDLVEYYEEKWFVKVWNFFCRIFRRQ